jgi:hypothetical protein
MIVTHKMDWDACLSRKIWPHVKKGWIDEFKYMNFFWGLGGDNLTKLAEVINVKKEEWWFVDVGYLTKQIVRYPEPKIVDKDNTYFRIVKEALHTNVHNYNDPSRLRYLQENDIVGEFPGWNEKGDHILICPSSETVTRSLTKMSVKNWTKKVIDDLKEVTDRPVKVRMKPRPKNKFWGTDIDDDLENCHACITSLSLSAIDSVMKGVPIITYNAHAGSSLSAKSLQHIEKLNKPSDKIVNDWLASLANNQFTLDEIGNGTAYEVLKKNYG